MPLDDILEDIKRMTGRAEPPAKPAQAAQGAGVFEDTFTGLQGEFKKVFQRDFSITGGADTPMHRKLHQGKGRDVRVHDLTPEQGDWLVKKGVEMGFDVRDFRRDWKKYGGSGPHIHFDVGGHGDIDQDLRRMLSAPEAAINPTQQTESPSYKAAIAEVMQNTGVDEEAARAYLDHDEGKKKYPGLIQFLPTGAQADWSGGTISAENAQAMIDELMTNQHADRTGRVGQPLEPQAPAVSDEPLVRLSTSDRPLVPQGSIREIPPSNAQPGIQSPVEHYGVNHSLRVDDLVDGIVDNQGKQTFTLKAGVTPEQFQTALFERANAQQGFDQSSLERYRKETGQFPVGRFFQGADPSNPDLAMDELLKWVKTDEGGNLQFLYNVPQGVALGYQRFLQPEAKEQAASTAQDLEAEQFRQARQRTTIADKVGKVLTEASPVGALAGIAGTMSPEAAKNLRQYEENLLSKATLGYVDPTNVSIGQGVKNDSVGGEVGGMIGGAVPIVAATALGGPAAGVAAAGAQPFLERRQNESDYDFRTRARDAALNAMLTAVGGKVSGEQLSALRKLVLDQVVFTGGTALLKPLTHGEYATLKELGAGAALGVGMSALAGVRGPERSSVNSPENLLPENQRATIDPTESTSLREAVPPARRAESILPNEPLRETPNLSLVRRGTSPEQAIPAQGAGVQPGKQTGIEADLHRIPNGSNATAPTVRPEAGAGKPKAANVESVNTSDYVNLDKFRLSDAEKSIFERAVKERVAETGADRKARVTFEDIRKQAAELAPELLDDLRPPKPGEALHPATYYAAKQRLEALTGEASRIRSEIETKGKALAPEEVAKLEEQAAKLENDAKALLDVVIPARSANGRNLAFERMMVDRSGFDVVQHVARAQKIAERGGVDTKGNQWKLEESGIRAKVARGKEAQARLTEIENHLAQLRDDPAVRAFEEALKETRSIKRAAKKEGVALDAAEIDEARKLARQKVAESWKTRLAEAEQAARVRLKEKLNPNTVHDVTDIASMVADLSVIGAAKLARKGIDKAVWARELIDEFGEQIKPHLPAIFKRSTEIRGQEYAAALKASRELRLTGGDLSKFSPEQVERLLIEAEQQRRQVQQSRVELARTYAKLQKTHAATAVSAFLKTGLLGPVKMMARDFVGTGGQQVVSTLDNLPAAFVDMVVGSVTGRRTVAAANPATIARSAKEFFTTGMREFGEIMRHGASERELEKMNLPGEVNSSFGVASKVIDPYINTVMRARTGLDNLWSNYAFRLGLETNAKAQALSEAKAGKIGKGEVAARTRELIASPPEDLAAQSIFDAEYSTYHSDNPASAAIRAAKQKVGPWGTAFFETFVLPFERTSTNIAKMLLYDYTPISPAVEFGKTIAKGGKAIKAGAEQKSVEALRASFKDAFTPEAQKQFVNSIARGVITGPVGLLALGYVLGSKGLMTGAREDTYSESERDKAAGKPPMAVYNPASKTWHQVGWLGPWGVMMGIGAQWSQSDARGALKAGYQEAMNMPYVRGAQSAVDLMKATKSAVAGEGSDKLTGSLGRIASRAVPSPVADIAEAFDASTAEREVKGFVPQLQQKIPFLRNQLPQAQDALGNSIERRRTDIFDPTKTRTAKTDKTIDELERLNVGLSKPKQKPGEPEALYRERVKSTGQKLLNAATIVMASSRYRNADDAGKKELIESAIEKIKSAETKKATQKYKKAS